MKGQNWAADRAYCLGQLSALEPNVHLEDFCASCDEWEEIVHILGAKDAFYIALSGENDAYREMEAAYIWEMVDYES